MACLAPIPTVAEYRSSINSECMSNGVLWWDALDRIVAFLPVETRELEISPFCPCAFAPFIRVDAANILADCDGLTLSLA